MSSVLLIDDDLAILEELADLLVLENYEVFTATNGSTGIQLSRDHIPDIIICDINMPELDGFEVLAELRKDSKTASIPFVFLTARDSLKDLRTGMNLGADDYLTKPPERNDLLNAIQIRLTRQSEQVINRIRQFAHRTIVFQESERQSLANLIQNDLSSVLSGLKLALGMVEQLPSDAQSSVLNNLEKIVDDAIQQINSQALVLWPSALGHLGLLPSILLYLKHYTATTQIEVDFQSGGLDRQFDSELAIMVYRIVQDALTNVHQHAGVDTVSLRIWAEDDILSIQIIDKGVGFNLEEVLKDSTNMGLVSIQERTLLLDGELTILSSSHEGTQIYVKLPLTIENSLDKGFPTILTELLTILPTSTPIFKLQSSVNTFETNGVQHRVAIVDDNEIYRWGIRNMLESESEWVIVAEATTGQQALRLVADLHPDILLMSMTLPDIGGFQLAQQLYEQYPQIRVVILSNYVDGSYAIEGLKMGAKGYISKKTKTNELLYALHTIMSGEQYISNDIGTASLTSKHLQTVEPDAFSTLTEREREIFHFVLDGQTNKQIADKLIISPRTAETHRMNMMRKLGLKGQVALVRYAMEHNLIDDSNGE